MKKRLLTIIGPGILVAATGVGAGDLATGAFTGSKLGVAVLWAVLLGAGLKFLLNEGLARWQLATGTTLLEGSVANFGRPVQMLFLAYLLVWSFLVSGALMSACGVTYHAIAPFLGPETDKIIYGLMHSALAVLLIRLGGYRLFEKVMSVCIAVMFVVVVATAVALQPAWGEVARGIFRPTIPPKGIGWTVALMGGVGGTVTVLCYGYWIREEGRSGAEDLAVCRIDLAVGYAMTALFGLAMVIIGTTIEPGGKGTTLIVNLADRLESVLGPVARWAFLVGAYGAVFSSLLGVWQSVPYLFADFWGMARSGRSDAGRRVDTKSWPYQIYMLALATVPAVLLWIGFEKVQKYYAVIGAMFIPMLAVALLVLNGRSKLVGRDYRNSWFTALLLIGAIVFFLFMLWLKVFPAEAAVDIPADCLQNAVSEGHF